MKHTMIMNTVRVAVLGLGVLVAGAASAEPHYVGAKACGGCHKAEFQDWQRSVHGKTMELLAAGKRAGPKHKAGLDPDKDYSNDEKCWKCHTTGFKKDRWIRGYKFDSRFGRGGLRGVPRTGQRLPRNP